MKEQTDRNAVNNDDIITAFRRRVSHVIEREALICDFRPIIVGLSGGADSVALLRVLLAIGADCRALHVNFMLRGSESDRDESFCKSLCSQLAVPLHIVRHDTYKYAADHHVSIEMAARSIRYEAFEQLRQEIGAQAIAVAHHCDDNAETILLNLVRGTGLRGLIGMRYRNYTHVIRPLLDEERSSILEYLDAMQQGYVTDSSNLVPDVKRNKIRLEIMPLLHELNPSVVATLCANSKRFGQTYDLYAVAISEAIKRVCTDLQNGEMDISIRKLLCEVSPECIMYEMLHDKGFSNGQIQDMLRDAHNTEYAVYESKTYRIVRDADTLCVRHLHEEVHIAEQHITIEQITNGASVRLWENRGYITFSKVDAANTCHVEKMAHKAYVDAAKVQGTIVIRPYRAGDRFTPFGMKGSKSVADFLTDSKVPKIQKANFPVVCDDCSILWVVGMRISEKCKIDSDTSTIIAMTLSDMPTSCL